MSMHYRSGTIYYLSFSNTASARSSSILMAVWCATRASVISSSGSAQQSLLHFRKTSRPAQPRKHVSVGRNKLLLFAVLWPTPNHAGLRSQIPYCASRSRRSRSRAFFTSNLYSLGSPQYEHRAQPSHARFRETI